VAKAWELKTPINPKRIHVSKYAYDDRIKWDTYIVTVDRIGVFGFTDGSIEDGK
jgi:hypothetical protein